MTGISTTRSNLFCWCLATLLVLGGCAINPVSYETTAPAIRGALFEYPLSDDRVTGIAISQEGRTFVNFPRWDKDPLYSVAEVMSDGSLRPYPDEAWNRWGDDEADHPEAHFVCVQSLFVDDDDFLWILDPASPSLKGVVPGGAKLLKVNLETDVVERVIPFDALAAPHNSYLNDVRLDPAGDVAYITDSGLGGILVVNLAGGTSRRLLDGHPSTSAEPGYVPVIEGRKLRDVDGNVPQIHADGLAVDAEGTYLYYHALTARTLYRIKTSFLKDPRIPDAVVSDQVENVAVTGAVDGMLMDHNDNLYLTALEENAIKRYRPDSRVLDTIVRDERIQWPDSLAISPDDYLYVTASQIHRMPRFNRGGGRRVLPYMYFKIWLAPM
ncbi:MAG TPA: L-dopachrome tautomerase-related protein [Geobacteraceae bacterium]|nr:L-dopachrome tautomerase-related protein [Geobacteraceae bacterium]